MAEGGDETFEMKPLGDDNKDDNEINNDLYIDESFDSKYLTLEGKKGNKKYRWKKHSYGSDDDEEETSFWRRGWKKLKSYFPDSEYRKLDIIEGDDGSLRVRDKLSKKFTTIINSSGEISTRIGDRLRKILGESFHTKLQRNAQLNDEAVANQNRLREENEEDQNNYDRLHDEETDNLDSNYRMGNEIQKRIVEISEQINRLQNEIDERNTFDMNIIKRLPIRERVRAIFKKYGLTVTSIMLAIWAVAATIMATASSGVESDKKQAIKKSTVPSVKINNSFPTGIVVNFIFDAALDVIEDLVENSWLLIEMLVIFYIDKR